MSQIIQILPDHVANQIAAGEVVQRPASVVKELLENAVDAGAKFIQLIVKDAGKTLIQVVDDGKGMSEFDARISFERHATSKIRITEDIFQIKTMGFRGEALASIAAVAQVEMKTKQADQDLGTLVQIEASEIKRVEPCQTTVGTSISVKNLFYNIPARRNFLKADPVEMRHILEEFHQISMAHPELSWSFFQQNERIFQLNSGNLRQRILGLLGQKWNISLIPIEEEAEGVKIYGFISKPDVAKKIRGDQYFFVNLRFIKSPFLHHAVMSAYEDILPAKTYPFYCIHLELNPAKIDVNVHPTKQEIKFEDEKMIYQILKVTCRHSLAHHSVLPTIDFELEQGMQGDFKDHYTLGKQDEVFTSKINSATQGFSTNKNLNIEDQKIEKDRQKSNLNAWETLYQDFSQTDKEELQQVNLWSSSINSVPAVSEMNLNKSIQVGKEYVVCNFQQGLLIVHIRNARERIRFEQYKKNAHRNQSLAQILLFPVRLQLSLTQVLILNEILEELNVMGFGIRDFGNHDFVVDCIPADMEDTDLQSQMEEILEIYTQSKSVQTEKLTNAALALSVVQTKKMSNQLSDEEIEIFIQQLFSTELPELSPSGKKTYVKLANSDMKVWFD